MVVVDPAVAPVLTVDLPELAGGVEESSEEERTGDGPNDPP